MIYYNANANIIDTAKIIQNVLFKLDNALQSQGIQGYTVDCITFDVASMKSVYQISHIGYPVEVLFYNGTNYSKDATMTFTYGKVSDIFAQTTLTPQQKENAIDRQIEETNTSIAMMLYDQIKTHQVLKSFEKIVNERYVATKSFPSPEVMWEQFKSYHEQVRSAPSNIAFPTTIDDWYPYLESNIKHNTAFCHAANNIEIRRLYDIKSCRDADFFTVYYDLEEYYNSDHRKSVDNAIDTAIINADKTTDINRIIKTADPHINSFFNELNGIPKINQNGIPMTTPQTA